MSKINSKDTILKRINKSALKFLEPLSLTKTFSVIVHEAIRLVGADEGLIILESRGELQKMYAYPKSANKAVIRRRGFAYKAFKKQKAFLIQQKDFEKNDPRAAEKGVESILFIPLSYKNKSIGVLIARSYTREFFTSDQLQILKLFGALASLGIAQAQVHEQEKKAIEMRDLFISMAAHELRTPLTTVYGYAQLLQKKLKNSKQLPWISEIVNESVRIKYLLNELLDLSRINTGKLQYSWKACDLREIISRATKSFSFSYPQRKLQYKDSIVQEKSLLLIADYDKLLQVILNLLDNAVKFSPQDSPVDILLEKGKKEYILTIKNYGKGVPVEEKSKIFEQFYKSNANENKQGMGLGLFIAQSIIKQHKGTIKLNSVPNKETSFKIILPRAKI